MYTRGGGGIGCLCARPLLIKLETSRQILGGDALVILWEIDVAGNGKRMLDQCRSNCDDSLNGNLTTLLFVGLLGIASRRGKVCIKVGIAKTPVWCYVEPGIGGWDWYLTPC